MGIYNYIIYTLECTENCVVCYSISFEIKEMMTIVSENIILLYVETGIKIIFTSKK